MVQIVIPMAGLGTRFKESGYRVSKPLIEIHGQPMFKIVAANLFSPAVDRIVVVAQKEWNLSVIASEMAKAMKIPVHLVEIDYVTDGPAGTVELASKYLQPELPVVVANSDQYVEGDLSSFYNRLDEPDVAGAILTMEDDDPKWSYVGLSGDALVGEVREKEVISNLATVGIYGFSSANIMLRAIEDMRNDGSSVNGEFYVGPAYNCIIRTGGRVVFTNLGPITRTMFGMGIPADLDHFISTETSFLAARKAEDLFGHA